MSVLDTNNGSLHRGEMTCGLEGLLGSATTYNNAGCADPRWGGTAAVAGTVAGCCCVVGFNGRYGLAPVPWSVLLLAQECHDGGSIADLNFPLIRCRLMEGRLHDSDSVAALIQ
eukprot:TRINITY_DN2_c0_g1_i1.p1 TRINITY_DN2_c0_g1~~TRINITY_DN2_c0_g1_i1.p1  ORF type:complete len:114 (+),score=7.28 TRINITY_DN2_c0_g1_i1:179-520(+)